MDDIVNEEEDQVLTILHEFWEEGGSWSQSMDNFNNPNIIHTNVKPKSVFLPIQIKGIIY